MQYVNNAIPWILNAKYLLKNCSNKFSIFLRPTLFVAKRPMAKINIIGANIKIKQ